MHVHVHVPPARANRSCKHADSVKSPLIRRESRDSCGCRGNFAFVLSFFFFRSGTHPQACTAVSRGERRSTPVRPGGVSAVFIYIDFLVFAFYLAPKAVIKALPVNPYPLKRRPAGSEYRAALLPVSPRVYLARPPRTRWTWLLLCPPPLPLWASAGRFI